MSRLSAFLGLGGGELGPLSRLACVHAALGAGIAAGDVTVQSVFLARAGAELLPAVLLLRALLLPLLAAMYARLAGGRSARAVLSTLGVAAAATALAAPEAMALGWQGALAAYVAHEVVAGLLTVHWGVYLLAGIGGARALRGVSLVYSGARIGAAAAGGLLVVVVAAASAPSGMYLAAGFFLILVPLSLAWGGREGRQEPAAEAMEDDVGRPTREGDARGSFALLRTSPLLVAIVVATATMVLVRYLLRYQQQAVLDAIPEAELAHLLAAYAIGANVVTALVQLVVMSRLLPWLGLTGANTLYAVVLGAAQIALLAVPGVGAALFARFADDELKHAIKTPVSSLFYEAFPPATRATARAVVLGLASPVTQAAGALVLLGVVAGASLAATAAAGVLLCALFGLATLVQNRRYRGSLAARKG